MQTVVTRCQRLRFSHRDTVGYLGARLHQRSISSLHSGNGSNGTGPDMVSAKYHQKGSGHGYLQLGGPGPFILDGYDVGGEPTILARNVLDGALESCCLSPRTGYFRDGLCRTDASDQGRHVICAQISKEFLDFTKSRGNDLATPSPPGFPGLKPGDKWCLCALRWKEAMDNGCAPKVYLRSTHAKALEYVSLESLRKYAVDGSSDAKEL